MKSVRVRQTYSESGQTMTDHARQIGASKAGRRFIAQMTLYNAGDFERLRQFMHSGYDDIVLMSNPVDRRLLDLKAARKLHGRLKVAAVESAEEYALQLVMASEKGTARLRLKLIVGENYPHQIKHYSLLPIEADE